MQEAFKKEQACVQDILNFKKDGTPFLNRLLMLPIHGDGKLYYVGFQNDITQRRGLRYENQMLKDVMDHEIRHAINNPLGIILGKISSAIVQSKIEEEIKKVIDKLEDTFKRINDFSIHLEDLSQFKNF